MNAPEHDPLPPDAAEPPTVEAAGPEVADPPKRRRAPRKPKAQAVAVSPEASPLDSALPGSTDAPSGEGTDSRPVHRAATEPDAGTAAPGTVTDQGEPIAPGEGADAQGGDSGPRSGRRGRNRRRGRRGGERRGEGADAAAGLAEEGDAAGVAAPAVAALPQPQPDEVFAEVLSGAFDAEPAPEEAEAAVPPRRVLPPEPDSPKLQKVLAQAGVGSRRDLEQMITEGRLTVNGQPAHTGQRISFGDRIQLDGKPVRYRIAPPPPRVLAYHKPAGEVVTHDDPQQRPTVFRRLPRLAHGKWQSVGRLDINTEGLLLFTNSGELANQLMHPRFGVEREYAVRSLGVLDEEAQARLLEGVEIDGQRAAFKSIADGGGEGVNHWYRVVITEGRNREVRRLFEAVGHAVSRLIRIRYGSVVLPRGLKRGVWVDLGEQDVRMLRRLAQPQRAEGKGEREPSVREGRDPRDGGRPGKRRRGGRGPREGLPLPAAQRDLPGPYGDHGDFEDHDGPEHIDGAAIPNPLQQTYDKRAIQQARAQRRELPEDGPIPNPLQQTYDKRHLQRDRQPRREFGEDGPIPNPLQQTYDKRFASGPTGGPAGPRAGKGGRGGKPGKPGKRGGGQGGKSAAGGQPDPMRTSVGYIGADAFLRKSGGGAGGRGRGGPRGGRGR
jgi:23S rRNA pseudouridine2605 synthase